MHTLMPMVFVFIGYSAGAVLFGLFKKIKRIPSLADSVLVVLLWMCLALLPTGRFPFWLLVPASLTLSFLIAFITSGLQAPRQTNKYNPLTL